MNRKEKITELGLLNAEMRGLLAENPQAENIFKSIVGDLLGEGINMSKYTNKQLDYFIIKFNKFLNKFGRSNSS